MRVIVLQNILNKHKGGFFQCILRLNNDLDHSLSLITKLQNYISSLSLNDELHLGNYFDLLKMIYEHTADYNEKELIAELKEVFINYNYEILKILKRCQLLNIKYFNSLKDRNDALSIAKIFEVLMSHEILNEDTMKFFQTTKWSFNSFAYISMFNISGKRITLANVTHSAFSFVNNIVETMRKLYEMRILKHILKKTNREECIVCAMQLQAMLIKYNEDDLVDPNLQNIVNVLCSYLSIYNFKRLSELSLNWIRQIKISPSLVNDLQANEKINQYFETVYLGQTSQYATIKV